MSAELKMLLLSYTALLFYITYLKHAIPAYFYVYVQISLAKIDRCILLHVRVRRLGLFVL